MYGDAAAMIRCKLCGRIRGECRCGPCPECGSVGRKECWAVSQDRTNLYVVTDAKGLTRPWFMEIGTSFLSSGTERMLSWAATAIVFSEEAGGRLIGVELRFPLTRFEVVDALAVLEYRCTAARLGV